VGYERARRDSPYFVAQWLPGEVEGWRDGFRCGLAESGPFVCRCLNGITLPRFHTPAYRTGQAELRIRLSEKTHDVMCDAACYF
jgi:hypothetical protein